MPARRWSRRSGRRQEHHPACSVRLSEVGGRAEWTLEWAGCLGACDSRPDAADPGLWVRVPPPVSPRGSARGRCSSIEPSLSCDASAAGSRPGGPYRVRQRWRRRRSFAIATCGRARVESLGSEPVPSRVERRRRSRMRPSNCRSWSILAAQDGHCSRCPAISRLVSGLSSESRKRLMNRLTSWHLIAVQLPSGCARFRSCARSRRGTGAACGVLAPGTPSRCRAWTASRPSPPC